MSVMCICNGSALIKNQKELCKQILNDQEVFEKIYVPLRETDKDKEGKGKTSEP
jgi:hypothetical protein